MNPPIRTEEFFVTGLTVLASCSDGSVRAVVLPDGGAKKLKGHLTHKICGGVLTLSADPIANVKPS